MTERLNDIVNTLVNAKGRPLLLCAPASQQAETVSSLYESVRQKQVLNPTSRNHTDIVHMSLYSGDEPPDRFSSLVSWARALFLAAGYRDQFEGLVLLNIAGVTDKPRLMAVAEGIRCWCRRCYVVLYGYEGKEQELMTTIDMLDLYGTLRVVSIDKAQNVETDALAEIDRRGYNISLTARKRLAAMLQEVCDKPGFTLEKYFNALGIMHGMCSLVTDDMLEQVMNDPYSYHNRLCTAKQQDSRRRIGFGAADDGREACASTHR